MPGRQLRASDHIAVGFTPNNGRTASPLKESAKCQKETLNARLAADEREASA